VSGVLWKTGPGNKRWPFQSRRGDLKDLKTNKGEGAPIEKLSRKGVSREKVLRGR